MRTQFVYFFLLLTLLSCNKSAEPKVDDDTNSTDNNSEFVKFTIPFGQQSSDKNVFKQTEYAEQKFIVKFNNSAIYTTIDTANQYDINKLYGFSDNNAHHQQFSARFGWRWKDSELHLFAYVYNNGLITKEDLGEIKIDSEVSCSIKVAPGAYIFKVNDKTFPIPRTSTTPKGIGYKLYPYFGGNEMAPHTISIWIKETV